MWAKVLFWILCGYGFIIGFSLGTRGDLLGFVGIVASNGMILAAFTLSIITRARETRHKPTQTPPKAENALAPSLTKQSGTDSTEK